MKILKEYKFGDEIEIAGRKLIYIGYDQHQEKEFLWDKVNKQIATLGLQDND